MDKKDSSDTFLRVRQIGILTTIPVLFVGGPAIGFFIGSWIDTKWQCDPYAKIILIVLGFIASCREVIRMIKEVQRLDSE